MTSVAPPRRALWKSKAVQILLGLAVSAACLWWAARGLINDPNARQQFLDAFRTADYRLLPILLTMLLAFYTLKAYRWKLLLSPLGEYRVWGDCFGPMLSGFAINNVLPARAGEVVRVVVFARRHSQPVASVLTTVALERILDMLAILTFLAMGLFSLPDMPDWMRKSAQLIGLVSMTGVLGAFIFLVWTQSFIQFVHIVLKLVHAPEGLRDKVSRLMETAAHGLSSLKSPGKLAMIVAVSLLQWSLNGGMMYLSLRSFGVDVPVSAAFVLLGVVALGVAVPATPGFFGVVQVCFTDTLQIFPVSRPAVLAASIYYHMMQYIPVTLIGLMWLSRSGFRIGETVTPSPTECPPADLPVAPDDQRLPLSET